MKDGRRYGFEFKLADAPRVSKSMRIAAADLDLHHLWIVYPGEHTYPVDEQVTVVSLGDVHATPS